jgi:AraC family transcriptional regulator
VRRPPCQRGEAGASHHQVTIMDASNRSPVPTFASEPAIPAGMSLHQLRSVIADISKALQDARRDERASAAMHLRRAAYLLNATGSQQDPPLPAPAPRLAAWQIRRVRAHIEARLETPIRNKELAALIELSEFHFSVAFRNSVGVTPHEFIIRRRIDRAQQLMLSTDMSLCDIAAECGLADQAHLSRLFRRVVGETPASWRRARVRAGRG